VRRGEEINGEMEKVSRDGRWPCNFFFGRMQSRKPALFPHCFRCRGKGIGIGISRGEQSLWLVMGEGAARAACGCPSPNLFFFASSYGADMRNGSQPHFYLTETVSDTAFVGRIEMESFYFVRWKGRAVQSI